MINIFGYGSLINPNSIANTLGRKVITSPAILHDYYRTWTASSTVLLNDQPTKVRFLDLTFKKGAFCNGVNFQVYKHELEYLNCRECGYDKNNVDIFIFENKPLKIKAITYTINDNNKSDKGCIPTKYKSLVEEGLSYHNKSFKQVFLATTENYDGCYIKGSYEFKDKIL